MSRRGFYAYSGPADDNSPAVAAKLQRIADSKMLALQQAQLALVAAQAAQGTGNDPNAYAKAVSDVNAAAAAYEAASKAVDRQSGTAAKDPGVITPVLNVQQPATVADQLPPQGYVQDHNYSPPPPATGGVLDSMGQWLWVIPAGVVAVGLGIWFVKRKQLSGYRRRRRSRR